MPYCLGLFLDAVFLIQCCRDQETEQATGKQKLHDNDMTNYHVMFTVMFLTDSKNVLLFG